MFFACFQKMRKTPMTVANPRLVPDYELNPSEIQLRRGDGISKACHYFLKLCINEYVVSISSMIRASF